MKESGLLRGSLSSPLRVWFKMSFEIPFESRQLAGAPLPDRARDRARSRGVFRAERISRRHVLLSEMQWNGSRARKLPENGFGYLEFLNLSEKRSLTERTRYIINRGSTVLFSGILLLPALFRHCEKRYRSRYFQKSRKYIYYNKNCNKLFASEKKPYKMNYDYLRI